MERKEAIEIVRKLYNESLFLKKDKEAMVTLIPELAESDDEKVRKDLIKSFNEYLKQSGAAWGKDVKFKYVNVKDAIAWIEKQGVKPTNNVETKFKVGEWIINAQGTLRHIINVDKGGYQTDGGWLTHDTYEKTFHLWTIQDAKDGDVLATEDWVFIFEKMNSNEKPVCHCHYDIELGFILDANSYIATGSEIYPATKEQRNLLFQKMKEAGYEWDAEEKELKKIEQKPAEWSEEDENRLNHIIQFLEDKDRWKDTERAFPIEEDVRWLKSLRIRKQWKPSGEQLDALRVAIGDEQGSDCCGALRDLLNDLKKL